MKVATIDESNAAVHQGGFVNFGGFFIRQFVMPKGSVHKGHHHNVDHLGNLVSGKVRVRAHKLDGSDEQTVDVLVPSKLAIRADYWHEIEALEDSFWECWFARAEAVVKYAEGEGADELRRLFEEHDGDANLVDWTS